MKDVREKVAFITGGGSGIGLDMAKVFTSAGMKVVIAALPIEETPPEREKFEEMRRQRRRDAKNFASKL